MQTLSYKSINYSEVNISELGQEFRIDADFWDAEYLTNEYKITNQKHTLVKTLAPTIKYGLSLAMNEVQIGYPILKMDNIMDILAEDDNVKYADIDTQTFTNFQLKKFDVLFNRVNSDEYVGRTGIYLLDGEHTFASYLVKADTGSSHTNCYLTIFLNSKYGKTSLRRVKRRAVNQANINAKELGNLSIPLPKIDFQKRIENLVLKAYEQKQASENLYRQAENILLSELGLENWKPQTRKFSLFDVSFEVENSHSLINLNQMLKSDRLDSEYWESKYLDLYEVLLQKPHTLLGSEVTIKSGFPFQSKEFIDDSEAGNDDEPFIRIRDCKPHYIDNETLTRMSAKYINETNAKKAQVNDIVIGMDGIRYFLGSLVSEPAYVNQRVCHISVKYESDITPEYALLIINGMIGQYQLLRKMTIADTVGHIKNTNVANLIIPISNHVEKISIKVREAINNHQSSKNLLSVAKRAVEIYIEQDEKMAEKYILENA